MLKLTRKTNSGGIKMNELGERIMKYRTDRSLSQLELSDLLDVSRQSISKWETGAAVPEISKLVKMAELFEIDLDELVLGKRTEKEDGSESPAVQAHPQIKNSKRRHAGLGLFALGIGAAVFALYLYSINGLRDAAELFHLIPFALCACHSFLRMASEKISDRIFGIMYSLIGWSIALSIVIVDPAHIHVALMYFIPYAACGAFCLLRLRNSPLWCTSLWLSFYSGALFVRDGSSPNEMFGRHPEWRSYLKPALTSWLIFTMVAVLIAVIIYLYRDKLFVFSKRKSIATALIGAAALVIKTVIWHIYPVLYMSITGTVGEYFYATFNRIHEMPRYLIDLGFTVLIVACLVPTFYWVRSLKNKKK